MSARPRHLEPAACDIDSVAKIGVSDGRALRRQRNMDAVRSAVLDVLKEGQHPTLAVVAQRAGVATRSIYRYFGDVDAAVRDAVEGRRNRVVEVFESEPLIGTTAPLAERLGMLVLRRLRLDRLVEPLDARGGFDELFDSLDSEVRDALAPELEAGDEQLALLLCALFRLHSVRSLRDVFDDLDHEIASATMRAAEALLAGSRRSA